MDDVSCLFEPVAIGGVTLRNRIVFPPMTTGYEEGGAITPRSRAFYRRIARGGAGLVILGDVSIQPSLAPTPYLFDDRFIPGLGELCDEVRAEGARVAAQLFHQEYDTAEIAAVMRSGGREAAIHKLHEEMESYCNRLREDQIETILERFPAAARRARDAGFDLIQVHGDRLVGMFSSAIMNHRDDRWGGPLEHRARFGLEVVRRIRAAVPELPVEYKLAVIREDPPLGRAGPTIAEARTMARWLEAAGVAAFHVSLANHGAIGDTIPPMGTQPYGCFVDLAAAVREVVDVPVTAVGRILEPRFAARIVESGQADLVALGRGLIAEPDWPRLVQQGRERELRPCIMCNHCTASLTSSRPLTCAVNARAGRPEAAVEHAGEARRVLVAGGGPAGMEAARVAALRGHDVTLVERGHVLGGQLHLCAAPSFKQEIRPLTIHLASSLARLEVDVRLGTELTSELLDQLRPDAVIVATGAVPAPLAAPGAERGGLVSAWSALAGEVDVGGRVVVVGGGAVGVETALFLAENGHRVTVVEMLDHVGGQESPTMMPFLERRLDETGCRLLTGHRVVELGPGSVAVAAENGAVETVVCDTIVNAVGTRRHAVLVDEIGRRGIELQLAGDCAEDSGGTIADAIHGGFQAGTSV